MSMRNNVWKKVCNLCLVLVIAPLVLYGQSGVPARTILREAISLLCFVAFWLQFTLFFVSRRQMQKYLGGNPAKITTVHKTLGYACIAVLLLHPFLLVLPRSFEAGVEPQDAFLLLLTSFHNPAVVAGICGWLVMLTLLLTTMLKKTLFQQSRTWRLAHSLFASVALFLTSWHAVALGRHMSALLSAYLLTCGTVGLTLLIGNYQSEVKRKTVQEVTP